MENTKKNRIQETFQQLLQSWQWQRWFHHALISKFVSKMMTSPINNKRCWASGFYHHLIILGSISRYRENAMCYLSIVLSHYLPALWHVKIARISSAISIPCLVIEEFLLQLLKTPFEIQHLLIHHQTWYYLCRCKNKDGNNYYNAAFLICSEKNAILSSQGFLNWVMILKYNTLK